MDFRDGGDVADSTDWLGTSLASLMPVEQAFRCHVCKDFYNSPMITSCNHTFCSLCIRRCLSVDGKCPLCRMTDQESKLRGNWALREAIDAFCKARPTVLEVARKPPSTPSHATRPASPSKRKAEDESPPTAEQENGEPQIKRTRTSARLSKTKATEAVAMMAQEEASAEEPLQVRDANGGDIDYEPDDGLVACPICWMRMKPWQVDRHIDTSCAGSPQKAKKKEAVSATSSTAPTARIWQRSGDTSSPFSTASTPTPPPERLPSINYSLLNDTALRKKLASLGLSTSGPKLLLQWRHKEWTTIWNANCDSARPKRKQDLLHDLEIRERTVGAGVAGGGSGSSGGIGVRGSVLASRSIAAANQQAAQIKDKDFDGAAWSAKHDTSFRDLIANARESRQKVAEAKTKNEGEQQGDPQPSSEDNKETLEDQPHRQTPTITIEDTDSTELPAEAVSGELVAPVIKGSDHHENEQHQKQLETEALRISSAAEGAGPIDLQ